MAVVRDVKDWNVDDGGIIWAKWMRVHGVEGTRVHGTKETHMHAWARGWSMCVSSLQDRGNWVVGRHEFKQTSEGCDSGAG